MATQAETLFDKALSGQRVKAIRTALDLTQEALAEAIGYGATKSMVSKVERGELDPGIPMLLYFQENGYGIDECIGISEIGRGFFASSGFTPSNLSLHRKLSKMEQRLDILTKSFEGEDLRLAAEIKGLKADMKNAGLTVTGISAS